jgi:excinuclease ABC subunit A
LIGVVPYNPLFDRVQNYRVANWVKHWPQWLDDRAIEVDKAIRLEAADIEGIQKYIQKDFKKKPSIVFEQQSNNSSLQEGIVIKGARENNLKNIDVTIPYNKITVITGVSGSGKSSLAFDTIFAQAQQRFSESTAQGSRGKVLGEPKLESISGLSPAIAISQRNVNTNPRSTVGTMTGIYDDLRTLFTHIGTRHCPECGKAITPLNAEEIIQLLNSVLPNTKLSIEPYGDNFFIYRHSVLDSNDSNFVKYNQDLKQAVKEALKLGQGAIKVMVNEMEQFVFQTKQMCYHCNHILFELTPSAFSFNNPESMCPVCKGLGVVMEIDPNKIVSKPYLSILDEASAFWGNLRKFQKNPNANWMKGEILALATSMNIDLEQPWESLPEAFRNQAIFGSDQKEMTFYYKNKNGRSGEIKRPVEGAFNILNRLLSESTADAAEQIVQKFIHKKVCSCCNGERLSTESRMVTIEDKRFPETTNMTISQLKEWIEELPNKLSEFKLNMALPILNEIHKRVSDYMQAGLSYLTLNRAAPTLSGGELQRLRLVSQLSSGITNIVYILDEPLTGLHYKDHEKILKIIQRLKALKNTVIIVEHNADIIAAADYIIDIGPGAGEFGGYIVATGTLNELMQSTNSETGKYLSGEEKLLLNHKEKSSLKSWVSLTGAKSNNLKNIDITFPTAAITCVTGVSGSGKSSLVFNVLFPAIENLLKGIVESDKNYTSITGAEQFDKIICLTQTPIGRTSRSNPATYTGAMDEIRAIFAKTIQAKSKGFGVNRFSFNSKEGQCPVCLGEGHKRLSVQFMPENSVECPVCKGKKFNEETLEIQYNDKNIFDVLELSVKQAVEFFKESPKLNAILQMLMDVGLGYLKLGQSCLTLSGGEAQRIKLAAQLNQVAVGKTLYLLDEPTTGLHFADINNLLVMLNKLTQNDNTVIMVEHNMDMIKNADWIIDLGPEGGPDGGYVMAQGTVEQVANVEDSYTGKMLTLG